MRTRNDEQIARRLVGPLEVLDHEDDGRQSGDPFEDPEDELEQADLGESLVGRRAIAIERVRRRPRLRVLSVRSAANLGHQAGQLASARSEERRQRPRVDVAEERPERLDERPVRKPAGPEREAAADEDADARSRHLIRECGDQAGLADPGLARHDDDPRFAGRRPRVGLGEAPELSLPPDETLAASTIHDAAMIGAPKCAPSRPAIDQLEAEAHAVMPASSNRERRRPRARHRRVRVAGPVQPMIPAISSVR